MLGPLFLLSCCEEGLEVVRWLEESVFTTCPLLGFLWPYLIGLRPFYKPTPEK